MLPRIMINSAAGLRAIAEAEVNLYYCYFNPAINIKLDYACMGLYGWKGSYNVFRLGWERITSAKSAFQGCTLFNAPITPVRFDKCRHTTNMLKDCVMQSHTLNTLNLRKVQNARGMFENCSRLRVSKTSFKGVNLQYADNMFRGCGNQYYAINPNNFNNIKYCTEMYKDCYDLYPTAGRIGAMSFYPATGIQFRAMFEGCRRLQGHPDAAWYESNGGEY